MTSPLSKAQWMRHVRSRLDLLLCDESGTVPAEVAIYTLSDPRDLRAVRYVGQTRSPRRRFLQHVNTARLWMPDADDSAWWVKLPKQRPLYRWIRELHRDEHRLPAMVVTQWVDTVALARSAERNHIAHCLGLDLALLNFEAELAGRQLPLALPAASTHWR
jgi:hypothetical protein